MWFGSVLPVGANSILAAMDKSQAAIHFNPDGTIIHANENFLNAMGYTLKEILGKHHRIFVERDYAASDDYAAFWESLRAGTFQCAQYKRMAKGGREVYIEASYNPVLDSRGRVVMVVKFATDVTTKTLKMKEVTPLNSLSRHLQKTCNTASVIPKTIVITAYNHEEID